MRRIPAGDDLIATPDLTATRAITVRASADQVWPWIAQLGQGRGGFYSYDFLENLVGCDIHSADRIIPGWQDIKVGDEVRLAPAAGLTLSLWSRADRWFSAVGLRWGPLRLPTTSPGRGCSTTSRTGHRGCSYVKDTPTPGRGRRFLLEPAEAVSFVMSQKMLRGIRDRAEQVTSEKAPFRRGARYHRWDSMSR